MTPRLRRRRGPVAAAALISVIALAGFPAAASADVPQARVGILPPANPAANVVPPRSDRSGFAAVDYGRRSEGLGPMRLPSNFGRLSGAEQLLVVLDLERTARGLPPIVGLSAALDGLAARAAAGHYDPPGPAGYSWSAIWGMASGLASTDWEWMYDDGPGGSNGDCPPSGGAGCWGHRDAILGGSRAPLVAGTGASGGTSFAAVIVDGFPTAHLVFTWAHELRYFDAPPGPEPLGGGYDVALSDGGVASIGARWHGADRSPAGGPAVAIADTDDGGGYLVLHRSGVVRALGNASSHGPARLRRGARATGIAWDPATGGYWVAASDGGVYGRGAPSFGSPFGRGHGPVGSPLVGLAATPAGDGYVTVQADGQVDAFGGATYHGSAHLRPGSRAVGVAYDAATGGYWVAASDGRVYALDARAWGSPYTRRHGALRSLVTGIAAASDGAGYVVAESDGAVAAFGHDRFAGSAHVPSRVSAVGIAWR